MWSLATGNFRENHPQTLGEIPTFKLFLSVGIPTNPCFSDLPFHCIVSEDKVILLFPGRSEKKLI